ncbi:hypothetical protein SERLA73DRAFT_48533 [Serpula lacrymans var. lacrymans S7.3]|uniref:Uncharacterized protein n=1 Tax=Serpula lacrymans var. lacrymans (strain S7.3) TaxID=936435 RepID=F8PR73_SERL3|nr:hypothetical protein SERLA73DRAFT_48533 [Serpula lacrymans var. lacrymans S7.3]
MHFFSCPTNITAKFRAVLHRAIQTGLREGADDIQINGALQLQIGWMHIHGKNVPALGRVSDPDDILTSVLVEDSQIQPDTYQVMPSYYLSDTRQMSGGIDVYSLPPKGWYSPLQSLR